MALPPGAPPGLPVALCLHPRGCNARWVVDALRLQDHVALEVRAGMAPFALVAMDSGGRWWRPHADGGDPLAEAMEALLPWARERYDLGPRVALLGWSMGGLGVLQSPVTVPHRVEALVATSPALFLSSRVWPRDPEGPYAGPAQFEALDPLRHPSTLAGVPLRLDCGDLDPFAAGAEALLASLRGHAEGGLQPGCHDEAFWHRVAGAQARFLARHLAG
ncbi:MAG: hypothetical protein HY909_24820 [Deltaproteobacteria bacterium]|nr:hypothetical protein [Deltaproteobacteria bacterium]